MLKTLIVVFALVTAAVALSNFVSRPSGPSAPVIVAPKSAQEEKADNGRFEACRAKLKKAQRLELLNDLSFDGGLPHVVVGPAFFTAPLTAKQGFADTVNCFLMAGSDNHINFDLLDYRTGKAVAHYRYGKVSVD